MHHYIDIQHYDHLSADDLAYISRQFRALNDQQSGIFPSKALHIFAYSPDRKILGGLVGDISWGSLHIDTLWVAESYRHSGIGTSLMDRVEAEAISMDVQQAFLENTDFQALVYYRKRRYQVCA
jgi:ribosomal protein S18 acetylase RimI-like enzyme